MLGKMNWAGLSNYLVQPSDMEKFQTYLKDDLSESLRSTRSQGILIGGKITVLAGLQIRISAGVALMPSGLLVNFAQTDLTLNAADPTNPRIDRVELSAVSTQGTAVVDQANLPKTLDFQYVTTIAKINGVAAPVPALPAQTANTLSVGFVTIPATTVNLVQSMITQDPDNAYQKSYVILGNGSGFARYNEFTGNYEVSVDGVTWKQLLTSEFKDTLATIANNQVAAADVSGFQFDSAKGSVYKVSAFVKRKTDTNFVRALVEFYLIYNEVTLVWDIVGNPIGDDVGLAFSVALVSGTVSKLQYTSDSLSGANYSGSMKFTSTVIL